MTRHSGTAPRVAKWATELKAVLFVSVGEDWVGLWGRGVNGVMGEGLEWGYGGGG